MFICKKSSTFASQMQRCILVIYEIMKKTAKIIYFFCILILSNCLVGCNLKTDVDWSNIDWATSVHTSLSLPIGSMSAKFGDFLGTSQFSQITIDEQGRYVFMDTMRYAASYHPINLSEYATTTHSRWDLSEQLHQLEERLKEIFPWIGQFGSIPLPITLPAGIAFDMEFPVDIDLTKLNIDYRYQRVDSIIVDLAQFTSQYTLENIDFKWSDIKRIQLILNENIKHADGDTLDLPLDGKDFGQPMPIDIRNFHMILMKDPSAESSADNIVDSIRLKIRFSIETSQPLVIDNDQYISYDFSLDFFDFSAMFGYFEASTLMHNVMKETPITDLWSGWSLFDSWVLPVSEPSIKLTIDHTLAVPLVVDIRHLYVLSETGEQRSITFDKDFTQTRKELYFPAQIAVTDPLDKHAIDSIVLDYTPENGNIDTLFTIHPYKFAYDFAVTADSDTEMKQFRITDNTDINLTTTLSIPFAFKEDVHITYSDTIHNINLTQLQLDSLLAETQIIREIEEVELQLFIVVENAIPFNIESELTLYNANDEIVSLSTMQRPSLNLSIDYPEQVMNGVATTPSINTFPILTVTKNDFEALASVKYIVFDATLGGNLDPVKLTSEASLRIQLGVTADIDAIIDLEEIMP